MHPKYPNVFSPFRLGPVELKNCFYSSPHAVPLYWLGAPTPDYVEYVAARARGGCGLIIPSMAALHRAKSIWHLAARGRRDLATGRMAVNTLEQEFKGKVAQLFPIGDAASARMWATASYEGHLFARFIGEPDAPRSLADVYFGSDALQLMALPEATRRALQPS